MRSETLETEIYRKIILFTYGNWTYIKKMGGGDRKSIVLNGQIA